MTFTEVRTDPLTGVSNRRALDETLESMFAMMHRYEHPFSVVLLDIDNFKQINDEQGHLYGDRMLKAVSRLLDDNVRDTDMVARYGGEEFVIVMPQTTLRRSDDFLRTAARPSRTAIAANRERRHRGGYRRGQPTNAAGAGRCGAIQRESGGAKSVVPPQWLDDFAGDR